MHDQNPLEDFKLLYGTGAHAPERRQPASVEWKRALRHTIEGGVAGDTDELLADVRAMVKGSCEGDLMGPPHAR